MSFNIPYKSGGDGVFTPTFTSGTTILSSGQSGTILTLTPPTGERVRLTALSTTATGTEFNTSVRVNDVDVITSKVLAGNDLNVANYFVVADGSGSSNGANDLAGNYPAIVGGVDETIKVVKTSGSTSNSISYGYQFGNIS